MKRVIILLVQYLNSLKQMRVTPVANPYGQGQAQAISGQDGLASFVGFEAKEYVIKELSALVVINFQIQPSRFLQVTLLQLQTLSLIKETW